MRTPPNLRVVRRGRPRRTLMLPLDALEALFQEQLALHVWPFFRIAGVLMVSPVFGTRLVPVRAKMALALALTVLLAPVVEGPQVMTGSVASGLVVAQEVMLGVAIGFGLQMVFDALVIAGQTIAMTMGLGFATMVDPQRGVTVPLLGQFFMILGILVFLSLGGHLALITLIAESFDLVPIGVSLSQAGLWEIVMWGTEMFAGALRIALPAVTALLVVNIAFGVMSRAAPTLNLFAVGFPTALLLGLVFLLLNIGSFAPVFTLLLEDALVRIAAVLGG